MSEKIEGTMRLEGLIEGTLPPFPDAREKLEKWAAGFAGGVIRISLQVDGSHFSALPNNAPFQVRDLSKDGTEPSNRIADGLSDLLRYFPPLERSQVFSTIRSIEYRPKQEVQTVYAVGPDGRAVTRQQTVPTETVKQAEPVSGREALRRGIMGLLLAAAVLGISTFFIDYRALWNQLTARVEPVKTTVDAGSFSPYFTIEVTGLDLRDGTLKLKVVRTARYPTDEGSLDALYADPPAPVVRSAPATTSTSPASSPATATAAATAATATASAPAKAAEPLSLVRRRLAVDSLGKGTVWLDYRDKDGRLIGGAALRVEALEKFAVLETAVPAPTMNRQPIAPASITVLPE
jgi:hypothetical protein